MTVTIGRPQAVQPDQARLSRPVARIPTVEAYAGTDPAALNPVFLKLVRNISPDSSRRSGGAPRL